MCKVSERRKTGEETRVKLGWEDGDRDEDGDGRHEDENENGNGRHGHWHGRMAWTDGMG